MDLYGDLPPAQGEATAQGETNAPRESSRKFGSSNQAVSTKNPSGRSSVSTPSFATFKPRQTSKIVATQKKVSVATATAAPTRSAAPHRHTEHSDQLHGSTTVATSSDTLACDGIMSYEINGIPYDPGQPNDYLEWCEERLDKKRAKRLEEENRLVLSAMEMSRKKLEIERLEAAKSGDIKRLEASALSGGQGGRGRGGNSNLPAWMTQQTLTSQQPPQQIQEQQQHQRGEFNDTATGSSQRNDKRRISIDNDSDNIAHNRKRGLFTNPSCVLLLENIEKKYDSNLEKEMTMECEKYGPIRSCIVQDCKKPETEGRHQVVDSKGGAELCVQVFICFARQESAVKAFRELNGRYFDGRQISASFYDEALFWQ